VITESAMAGEAIAQTEKQEDVLEMAVREHARVVYRIAYSVLRNPAEAEDATQETFLRALRYGKKFDRIENPKAWLARVAWRVAVERRRQVGNAAAALEPRASEIASPGAGAEQALLEQERNALLDVLIAALPEQLRGPLVLSAIEELSPREIAETLDVSEAAVRSRAFRARQILRERLLARMGDRK
jgi:RNA polymerase sigma-70 factor (ECF subfamily)